MEHSSSVLALAGALLLAGGGGSRLESVTSGFAERSAASTWSRPLRTPEQVGTPVSGGPLGGPVSHSRLASSAQPGAPGAAARTAGASSLRGPVSASEAALTPGGPGDGAASEPASGRFSLLTYNVAGLPEIFSGSDPDVNIALISPLLNHYDVALVQEDFSYHSLLSAHALHAYRSEPMRASLALMPDGLNWFSRFAFGWVHRVRWGQCNGYLGAASDCLADKGFSFSELTLAPGITIDVYDLHAEAGRAPMDMEVRRQNFEQLTAYMRTHSRQRAVIVAGDTNLKMSLPRDVETLDHFLGVNGLADSCRLSSCGDERIDRVLIRSSAELELTALGWWTDRRFVNIEGAPLSDHAAVGVELGWNTRTARDLVAGR